jgi:hypothetical protein
VQVLDPLISPPTTTQVQRRRRLRIEWVGVFLSDIDLTYFK